MGGMWWEKDGRGGGANQNSSTSMGNLQKRGSHSRHVLGIIGVRSVVALHREGLALTCLGMCDWPAKASSIIPFKPCTLTLPGNFVLSASNCCWA